MPTGQFGDASNVIQIAIVLVSAVWMVGKVSSSTRVLQAIVERMEKTIVRLQADHGRVERRVSRLEGMARVLKPESPDGDADE